MLLPDGFRRAFRLALGRAPVERDIDDEIAFHLAMREEKLRAAGLTAEEARAAARRRFGDLGEVADECRAIDSAGDRRRRRAELAESAWQDARYAVRSLARTPAFTAASLATLALGIGATTAIFSVVYGVLLRPLPYSEPDRLVQLWETSTLTPGDRNPVSVPNYQDWTARARSFAATVAYAFNRYTLAGDGTPEHIQGAMVLGVVGSVLGALSRLGRTCVAWYERSLVS